MEIMLIKLKVKHYLHESGTKHKIEDVLQNPELVSSALKKE